MNYNQTLCELKYILDHYAARRYTSIAFDNASVDYVVKDRRQEFDKEVMINLTEILKAQLPATSIVSKILVPTSCCVSFDHIRRRGARTA
jgi:hypothetical protein